MTDAEILACFPRLSALVIGDICLDRWCVYDPALAEPSRETAIPRIAVTSLQVTPGAGGTVANNLAALGCGHVSVLGVAGDDGFGYELRAALSARGIDAGLLLTASGVQTFTYTKLLNAQTGEEDQPRIDYVNIQPFAEDTQREIVRRLKAHAERFDLILVSDQAETDTGGAVTPAVREALAAVAALFPAKVIWVDSRLRPEHFRDVVVKPNGSEAREACERLFGRVDLQGLRRVIGKRPLVVTGGAEGAVVWEDSGPTAVPAPRVEKPVDICGAGDSFSAGAALTLAVTGNAVAAARFGNLVASVTIMKRGTGAASPEEVLAAARNFA